MAPNVQHLQAIRHEHCFKPGQFQDLSLYDTKDMLSPAANWGVFLVVMKTRLDCIISALNTPTQRSTSAYRDQVARCWQQGQLLLHRL